MEPLLHVLLIAIPALIVLLAARRLTRIVQRLRDPEALRRRLEVELRQVLTRAGVDPDSIRGADGTARRDLPPEVVREMRRVVLRELTAGDAPAAGPRSPAE